MAQQEQAVEAEIKAKGLIAPRITPEDIDRSIIDTIYFTAENGYQGGNLAEGYPAGSYASLGLLTFCVLRLRNGFMVTGESACASPENYNKELGQKIAYDNARSKIWALEGYRLRSELAETELVLSHVKGLRYD